MRSEGLAFEFKAKGPVLLSPVKVGRLTGRKKLFGFSSFIFHDQCSLAHACNALIADFGFDATIFSNARAGPVGRLRRCSQF